MSVTFYVDGWHEVPMVDMPVYAKDEYPNLDRSDFVDQHGKCDYGYFLDKNGEPYRIEKVPANDVVWPEVNRSNSNASMDIEILQSNLIGAGSDTEELCGSLSADAVKNLHFHQIPPSLSRLIEFARERGKGIYWA